MDRRTFLALSGATFGVTTGTAAAAPSADRPPLRLYSPASQLAADGSPLSDESIVAAWAEPTASNRQGSRSDPVFYDEGIPLISVDGSVAGIGSMLVADPARQGGHATYADSNERALLSLWDGLLDGELVRWDESHDQHWRLDAFGRFRSAAEREDYTIKPATAIDDASLADAAGLVITTPPRRFDAAELDALSAFVERGGALFVHDQANFRGLDETDNLNAIATRLDLAFRFNDDEVIDEERNAGAPFELLTGAYDRDVFGA